MNAKTLEALEPCPFCGCQMHLHYDPELEYFGPEGDHDGPCLIGNISFVDYADKGQALREWNRRASSTARSPVEARDEALIWFLKVIEGAGGQASATDYRGNLLNVFCDDREPTDTFNLAIERGFTTASHNTDFDESTVYLTDAGRAFLAALTAIHPQAEGETGWRLVPVNPTPEMRSAALHKWGELVGQRIPIFVAMQDVLTAAISASPHPEPGEL